MSLRKCEIMEYSSNFKKTQIIAIFILFLFLFIPVTNSLALRNIFNHYEITDLELNATRFYYQFSSNNIRYFSYIVGPELIREPEGEDYNASHVFKYGILDKAKYENGSFDPISSKATIENVTDNLVFPYHYNFVVDSNENIHTAYIGENYTLIYAIRDVNGEWFNTQLSQSDQWFAYMPSVALGENEEPRIAYGVSYKENALGFFGDYSNNSISGLRSIHYAVKTGSNWQYYDIGENHDPLNKKTTNTQFNYNPGILIEEGTVFIAFTNKVNLAAETRLQYLAIPEKPDEIENDPSRTYKEITFRRVYRPATIATIFRRPLIFLTGTGVLLAYGTWIRGGAMISFLADAFDLPNKNIAASTDQWETKELDPLKVGRPIESISGILDPLGTIHITWSVYDLFDESKNRFTYDAFMASISPSDNEIGKYVINRVTDSNNVVHLNPSIIFNEDEELEVGYLEGNEGENLKLFISTAGVPIPLQGGGEFGFLLAFVAMGIIVFVWIKFVNRIPQPEIEEEILPHMINLRDSITKD